MSDFSLTLVLQITTSKIINDVAKIQIKSEKITPFGGIFQVREHFSRFVGPLIQARLHFRENRKWRRAYYKICKSGKGCLLSQHIS